MSVHAAKPATGLTATDASGVRHTGRPSTWRLRCAAALVCVALGGCDSEGDKPKRADLKAAKPDAPVAKAEPKAPVGKVMFIQPADGATVGTRVEVEMGVEGKTVKPAGETERDPLTGHHHIIIDGGPLKDLMIVPKDETHLHYGDGATKATLLLKPGKHKLTMQFADGAHRSFGPDWAASITVNVVEGGGEAADAKADGKADAKADGKAG